ncbi:hypothetical protein SLEP1_g56681 [Rubroshorea leprosula]|uniref:Uncharacterized protein n=1 Tax=Rubroshorea leprosula TaxID=152421 RepID=A0AAV5MLR7_9ROSI|nr:hypothetical protein SLEP1_g56681 [Rubroshorea leprosula]
MARYFPHIDTTAQTILNQREKLHIYTYNKENGRWKSAVFKHPARFDTLAMEPKLKEDVINDLDAFRGRKDFFQKAGRAWKRGYLLHGRPGTGKSSLVAAIANHLRYNIYDLPLQSVRSDAELRRILTFTTSRSILLVEDIDSSTKASRDRSTIKDEQGEHGEEKLSSSNPGVTAFRQLADTYLQIEDHLLFTAIEDLLKHVKVTSAEDAQQLMIKSEEPQIILESSTEFLKMERNKIEEGN